MTEQCFEIVVYKVKDPEAAARSRLAARKIVETYPGFIDWRPLAGSEDAASFADIVTWSSLADAKAAATKAQADARVAPFFSQISEVSTFGHFA